MTDWIDRISPEDKERWDEFVQHFRRDGLAKIAESDVFVSLMPDEGWDVKFAVELGAAIMLDKPIMAIVMPGASVPNKLQAIADEIIYADLDTEGGRNEIAQGLARMAVLELEKKENE